MKTYQALSIEVIENRDEDIISTSYANFNSDWLFSNTNTDTENSFSEGGENQ